QDGETWEDHLASIHFACPACGLSIEEIEPRTFSFNSPHGACPRCEGLGAIATFEDDSVLPDLARSLAGGAIAPLPWLRPEEARSILEDPKLALLLKRHRTSPSTPLSQWSPALRQKLLRGDPKSGYGGVLKALEDLFASLKPGKKWEALATFRQEKT